MLKNSIQIGKITLGFILAVILWGAYVRASGSGAGCGSHWPLCNGQVIPVTGNTKTLVEFTHRITSGLSLILCILLGVSTFKSTSRGSFTRKAGTAAVFFILTEALLGAGLVLLELVENDKSVLRTFSLGIHLLNTFLLIGAVALTIRFARLEKNFSLKIRKPLMHWKLLIFSILSLIGILVLGSSGAMTALGDTLFPATSVSEGLRQDLSPTSHFLIQLRVIHPVLAVGISLFLIFFAWTLKKKFSRESDEITLFSTLLAGTLVAQIFLGLINISLLAPTALQLLHLLFADLIWLLLLQCLAIAWVVPEKTSK